MTPAQELSAVFEELYPRQLLNRELRIMRKQVREQRILHPHELMLIK